MNAILDALRHPLAERLGWGLIHLVWQGAAVALLLAGLLWLLRKRSANARYVCAGVALLFLPLALAMTVALLPGPIRPASADQTPKTSSAIVANSKSSVAERNSRNAVEASTLERIASQVEPPQPATDGSRIRQNSGVQGPDGRILANSATAAVDSDAPTATGTLEASGSLAPNSSWPPLRRRIAERIEPTLPWIVAGWLAGLLALSVWNLGGWLALRRLRHRGVGPVSDSVRDVMNGLCRRFGIRRRIDVHQSSRVSVPSLMGFLKPVILLPGSVLTGLTPSQLEAVLAHELAHIRRHDYLANLLQTAIETLLFFHPAVWWMSRRLRIERENCCDDLALSITDNRLLYAQSLTRLEELRQQAATARPAALTVAATGGSLLDRICRVLGVPRRGAGRRSRMSSIGAAGLSGLLTVAAALLLLLPGAVSPVAGVSANAAVGTGNDAGSAAPKKSAPSKRAIGGKPVNGLRLTLTADNTETTMLPDGSNARPIKLKLTFTNVGKKPIKLHTFLMAYFNLTLDAAGPNPGSIHKRTQELDIPFRQPMAGDFHVIAPGKSLESHWTRLFPGEIIEPTRKTARSVIYQVRKAGVYKLRYTYENSKQDKFPLAKGAWTGRVTSNEFVLTVRPPAKAGPPKPAMKPVDLGKHRIQVERHAPAWQAGRLFAVTSYPTDDLPSAKSIYDQRLKNKLGDGHYELVGRVPGFYLSGSKLEPTRFTRTGREITATIRYVRPPAVRNFALGAYYFRARLPQPTDKSALPPGTYRVKFTFEDFAVPGLRETDQGRIVRTKELRKITVSPLTCTFVVPGKSAAKPKSVILKRVKFPKDRGKLSDVYEKVRKGEISKKDAIVAVPGPKPKDQTPAAWFKSGEKRTPQLTADRETWLLFRSKQVDDNDRMWIESVMRSGNHFIVSMRRAIWLGPYKKNVGFHEIHGVNLGTLPPGEYTASWYIALDSFKEFDKSGWPKWSGAPKPGATGVIALRFTVAARKPKDSKVLKQVKSPKNRGTLRDAYQHVTTGKRTIRDELQVAPPIDKLGVYVELETLFETLKQKRIRFSSDGNTWLLFRSKQLDDNDVEWIERVERRGNEFTVTSRRAIWDGDYAKNITFHNVFGINLGKLAAGKYTVKWVIRRSRFLEFDKQRWPKDEKPAKPMELKASFRVLTGRTSAIKTAGNGLRLRATAAATIERGLPLAVKLEWRCDPAKLPAGVERLNTFLHDAFLELRLTDRRTGKTVTIKPYDPTSGLPVLDDGKSSVPLDGKPIPAWKVDFPLASGYASLVPGYYECRVRFTFPKGKTSWWRGTAAQWRAAGFWHGAAVSGAFSLKITADKRRVKKLLLPKRLRVETRRLQLRADNPKKTPVPVVVFRGKDAEEVAVRVRNGHGIAAKYYLNGKEFMLTGPPKPDDVNAIDEWRAGEKKGTYTIEVFETSERAGHLWHPGPGRGGYKVLWKKTFEVSLPARAAKAPKHVKSEKKPTDAGQVYEDKARRFRITIPKGWSATPASYAVQHYRDVFLCINSNGNKALRVTNERKGDTERYNPETVAAQLAPETATRRNSSRNRET